MIIINITSVIIRFCERKISCCVSNFVQVCVRQTYHVHFFVCMYRSKIKKIQIQNRLLYLKLSRQNSETFDVPVRKFTRKNKDLKTESLNLFLSF